MIAVPKNDDLEAQKKENISAGRQRHVTSVSRFPVASSSRSSSLTPPACMPGRNIHSSVHRIATRLLDQGKDTREEVCDVTEISRSTLVRAVRRKRQTGSVAFAPARGRGRPRSMTREDIEFLLKHARARPSTYLKEYQRLLLVHRFVQVPISTIADALAREDITRKKISKVAIERDPIKRADYRRRISQYQPYQLVCIDEMSKDDRTYARPYGRSLRGLRAQEDQEFVRHTRFSLCAALALDEGIIAARVVKGSFNRDLFEDYILRDVVCALPLDIYRYNNPFLRVDTCHEPFPWPSQRHCPRQRPHSPRTRAPSEGTRARYTLSFLDACTVSLIYRMFDRVPSSVLPRLRPNRASVLRHQDVATRARYLRIAGQCQLLRALPSVPGHHSGDDVGLLPSLRVLVAIICICVQ
jgi:transposase